MRVYVLEMALLMMLGCVFFWPDTEHSSQATITALPAQASNCSSLATLSWNQMNAGQRQAADRCDAREAQQKWLAVYGHLSIAERTQATVYEPL